MQVLHITPETNGYEVVELLANAINKKNSLRLIKTANGEECMTGGFIIIDTPQIRQVLDSIPRGQQYWFVLDFKTNPICDKFYAEEV
jgi:hypothetical protein